MPKGAIRAVRRLNEAISRGGAIGLICMLPSTLSEVGIISPRFLAPKSEDLPRLIEQYHRGSFTSEESKRRFTYTAFDLKDYIVAAFVLGLLKGAYAENGLGHKTIKLVGRQPITRIWRDYASKSIKELKDHAPEDRITLESANLIATDEEWLFFYQIFFRFIKNGKTEAVPESYLELKCGNAEPALFFYRLDKGKTLVEDRVDCYARICKAVRGGLGG